MWKWIWAAIGYCFDKLKNFKILKNRRENFTCKHNPVRVGHLDENSQLLAANLALSNQLPLWKNLWVPIILFHCIFKSHWLIAIVCQIRFILPFYIEIIFATVPCIPASNRKTIVARPVTVVIPANVRENPYCYVFFSSVFPGLMNFWFFGDALSFIANYYTFQFFLLIESNS